MQVEEQPLSPFSDRNQVAAGADALQVEVHLDEIFCFPLGEPACFVSRVLFLDEFNIFFGNGPEIIADGGAEQSLCGPVHVLRCLSQLDVGVFPEGLPDEIVVEDKDCADDNENERAEIERYLCSYFHRPGKKKGGVCKRCILIVVD